MMGMDSGGNDSPVDPNLIRKWVIRLTGRSVESSVAVLAKEGVTMDLTGGNMKEVKATTCSTVTRERDLFTLTIILTPRLSVLVVSSNQAGMHHPQV